MLTDFLQPLKTALADFGWRDVVDIVILAFIIYGLVKVLAKTRAMRVVLGLGVLLLFMWIAQVLKLSTLTWVFSWLLQAMAVFVVILFQPEIRRALEKIGRGRLFPDLRSVNSDGEYLVSQFEEALLNMAEHRIGAIIVFERRTGLADLVESGTVLNANVTAQLIETVFYPDNPLHDGAMVIKDGRIWAAGCFLPLSDNRQISAEFGTRHRASLGVSEVSDAYVLVVSEERGTISFAFDGYIYKDISGGRLTQVLENLYMNESGSDAVDLSADTKEIGVRAVQEAQRERERSGRGDK
ncbi:MAG: TIGR00159 family protein [Clostridia bacterium]|nr:TIGR00159 family protein [Clostridia bacterium]